METGEPDRPAIYSLALVSQYANCTQLQQHAPVP
jgi:hypothetical protein